MTAVRDVLVLGLKRCEAVTGSRGCGVIFQKREGILEVQIHGIQVELEWSEELIRRALQSMVKAR